MPVWFYPGQEDYITKLNELGAIADMLAGPNGWTPELAVVSDGARRVLQVTDWFGGEGTKPTTGEYIGVGGYVTDIADAIDIRGPQGLEGDTGDTGPANTLSIGSVTGGPTADATITGTAPAQTLNLVLPKGDTGDAGEDGTDGKEVEFQLSATHIQWRYVGDVTWIDLVALSAITGPEGEDGTDGKGIVSVTQTAGDSSPGSTDTYTITYTDATTSTFDVYNGADGTSGASDWAAITGKPTTLSGYGITDAVGTGDSRLNDSRTPTGAAGGVLSGTYPNPVFAVDMATQAELDAVAAAKQATLVSGTNIKSINGASILGSGNITIGGGSSEPGDLIYTARTLSTPDWLPTDGSIYLQSSYTALYAELGLLPSVDPLKLTNPGTLPTGNGQGAAFSPDGTYLAIGHTTSPYITIYKRSGDTFTKLTNPGTLPTGTGGGVTWTPDGNYLAIAHTTSPFVTIYSRSGDTFTKLANPASLPTGTGYSAAFSPDGAYLAIGLIASPYIAIYSRSGSTFTKLSNPASIPAGAGLGVSWSSDSAYLAMALGVSPYVTMYSVSGGVFTKATVPADIPTNSASGVAFSADDSRLVVSHSTLPRITIYSRSGSTLTKLPNMDSLPTVDARAVGFSPDGDYLIVGMGGSPFLAAYKKIGDRYIKLSNPSSLPAGSAESIAFSADGVYLAVAHATSPFVTIYNRFNYDTGTEFSVPIIEAGDASINTYIKT